MKPLFAFDLDSTITRCEILPLLARELGLEAEMTALTEAAMNGSNGFEESFGRRAALLKAIPLSRAREIVEKAPVNEKIAAFLQENRELCMILTGNLDLWIEGLIHRLGMDGRCLCSRGVAEGDRLLGVKFILNKGEAAEGLARPMVAIGDGGNDVDMMRKADYAIGFGGVRRVSEDVRAAADVIADTEDELCEILEKCLIKPCF